MYMDEQFFSQRLSSLRLAKNVSAREMSLAIGQNPSYINRIENQQTYPSMQCFFYICEYLGVTPSEFFDMQNHNPLKHQEIVSYLKTLDSKQLDIVLSVVKGLCGKIE